MTASVAVNDVPPRTRLVADGVATDFEYGFLIFKSEDLEVYLDEALQADGYAVSGVGAEHGGAVSFVAAPQQDTVVTLRRRLALKRTSDFQEGGKLRADALNAELDYQTAALQDLDQEQKRALRFHPAHPDADPALPPAETGRSLIWNQAGDGLENGPQAGDIALAETHALDARHARSEAEGHADRAEDALTGFYETSALPSLEIDFASDAARREEDERRRPSIAVTAETRQVDRLESGSFFLLHDGAELVLPSPIEAGDGFRVTAAKADGGADVSVRVDGGAAIRDLDRGLGSSDRTIVHKGEELRLLSDGAVWLASAPTGPSGPVFRALRTAKQALSVGTENIVAWDSIIEDPAGLWNPATSELGPMPPGTYFMTFRLHVALTDQDVELRTYVERKAGVTWYRHRDHAAWLPGRTGRFHTVGWSALISAGDGSSDRFRFVVRHDDAATREIAASDLRSAIEIIRIGH